MTASILMGAGLGSFVDGIVLHQILQWHFVGGMVLGWGLFNLIEGIIDHQILGIHYVRQVPHYTVYNLTFLVVGGFLLIVIGGALMKADTICRRNNIRN